MNHPIKNFLLMCSGCEMSIISRAECVTEQNKYAAVGATVLSTAVLASLSGGYAIYTVFESVLVSLCFGLLWGLIIFNLDRYVVSSLRKTAITPAMTPRARWEARAREFGHALPRLLLACFISIIITRPLELKLFESEITARVEERASELLAAAVRQKDAEFPDLDRLAEENRQMREAVAAKQVEVQRLHELAMEEALGKPGEQTTGRFGKGIVYEQRWAAFKKAEAELEQMRNEIGPKLAANERREAEIRARKDDVTEKARGTIGDRKRLLARLEAHSHLAEQNAAVAWASLFLVLLFILLETAPIIVKLLSKRGPYDEILEATEHRVFVRERKSISDINDQANTDVSLSRQHNAGLVAAELQLSRSTMSSLETLASAELREAREEIARLVVEQWKQAELESLRSRDASRRRRKANGSKNGAGALGAPAPPGPTPAQEQAVSPSPGISN